LRIDKRPGERIRVQCSWIAMVSVVVSIRTRKMFAEVRKMFLNARHAEQDIRERQAGRNF
jgi:hypothetical protein